MKSEILQGKNKKEKKERKGRKSSQFKGFGILSSLSLK